MVTNKYQKQPELQQAFELSENKYAVKIRKFWKSLKKFEKVWKSFWFQFKAKKIIENKYFEILILLNKKNIIQFKNSNLVSYSDYYPLID